MWAIPNIVAGARDESFSFAGFARPWSINLIRNQAILRTVLKYLLMPLYIIWHYFLFPTTRAKWYFRYRHFIKVIYRHRGRSSAATARPVQDSPLHKTNTILRDEYSDRLARLLILDISTLVFSNLHYTDIQSLSLASNHIRETLFPAGNIRHHTAQFRLNSCNNPTGRKRCWHCQVQICDVRCTLPSYLVSLRWDI